MFLPHVTRINQNLNQLGWFHFQTISFQRTSNDRSHCSSSLCISTVMVFFIRCYFRLEQRQISFKLNVLQKTVDRTLKKKRCRTRFVSFHFTFHGSAGLSSLPEDFFLWSTSLVPLFVDWTTLFLSIILLNDVSNRIKEGGCHRQVSLLSD